VILQKELTPNTFFNESVAASHRMKKVTYRKFIATKEIQF